MSIANFPKRPAAASAPVPAEPAIKEAFCVIGGSDTGLIIGAVLRDVPKGDDPNDVFFRSVVEHAFDDVPGFRFGVVLGNKSLA